MPEPFIPLGQLLLLLGFVVIVAGLITAGFGFYFLRLNQGDPQQRKASTIMVVVGLAAVLLGVGLLVLSNR